MPVLAWVAVVAICWCLASVVTALALGTYLHRRAEATDPEGALRPLDTGPLRLWLGEVPDSPAPLDRRPGLEGLVAGLPAPRRQAEAVDGRVSGDGRTTTARR